MTIRQVIGQFAKRRTSQSRQKLRTTVPNILTLGNACFGFFSIMQALKGNVVAAAYCILIAAILDFFDGRVARYFASVSYMGAELDSLCDVVSFCVAPATLLYSYCLQDSGIRAMLVLSIYLCAGLFRLAKFNTTTDNSSPLFSGLPTPMAACFLASIVMYHPWLVKHGLSVLTLPKGLMITTIIIALCMVSVLPFPSFKRYKITHRYGLPLFIMGMFFCGVGLLGQYPVLFFISSTYIIFSLCAFFLDLAMWWRVLKS